MSSPQIVPFSETHLAGAAELLGARHIRHRAALDLVAPGDPPAALETLWRRERMAGAVALRAGKVASFVLAEVGERGTFGVSAWVPHAGHATEDDELLRDVYAAAAETWVGAAADRHYVLVPATGRDLEPWYRLGFAHMHVEGLRSLPAEPPAAPEGIILRQGTRADLEIAEEIDLEISRIQERSPSFVRMPLDREARRAEWFAVDLKEEGLRYLVAEADGEIAGHTLIYRPEPVLGVPQDAAYLASTVVRPRLRGKGIGGALVAEILWLAAEAGYGSVVTNWRMTNLSASRFWPSLGFRPIYYRLHRALGFG